MSIKLPLTTIADRYRATDDNQIPFYPLDTFSCEIRGHIQFLPPAVLFDVDFTYMPSKHPALIEHFKMYADLIANLLVDHSASVCLDICVNNGLFLQMLKARFGSEILGIDPAHAPVEHARSLGVEILKEFFQLIHFKESKNDLKTVLLLANNVFTHNDELLSFATNVASSMHDGSITSFDLSCLVDVVEKGLIGTAFHKHMSTHPLLSLIPFLNRC